MLGRFFSTIILWSTIFVTLYLFGVSGGFFLLVLSSVATQAELYILLRKMGYRPLELIGLIVGLAMLIIPRVAVNPYSCFEVVISCQVISVVGVLLYIVIYGTPSWIQEVFIPTILGVVYVPLMFSLPVVFIRYIEFICGSGVPALYMIVWIVIVAKSSDMGGLIVGSLIGGQKMSPDFSPNKTVGGLVGAILFSVILGAVTQPIIVSKFEMFSMKLALIISVLLAVVSVVGDLAESAMKRLANVKDSGGTVPGIGGVFDLTDSVILTLPMGILLVNWLIL
ncbi:MAG: phosphatidate cytidylyltransferase [Puniceicoccales bacterium]|jgi:phosphatidate cytidylyltransferase|nr:phosphatidate cytidylyltransferase [Puniceicoccales bacterium]